MRLTLLLVLSLCVLSLEALLRPRKARKALEAHDHPLRTYNKDTIRAHIHATRAKKQKSSLSKLQAHELDLSNNGDITTATAEMWASCREESFTQTLDHFTSGIGPDDVTHFQQRYYVCGEDLFSWEAGNPVLFYFGNEAEVTAYIDYTGFMWEQAQELNALLVFAEHRYYGTSLPYSQEDIIDDTLKLQFLTTDQALADYATLIDYLQKNAFGTEVDPSFHSPIVGFGGSYGGMLGAWFRMKYPHLVDGVIAGSAPVWGVAGLSPEADPYGFAAMETYDASESAGVANDLCVTNIQQGWTDLSAMAKSRSGRKTLGAVFNLCSTPSNTYEGMTVLDVVDEAVSYMAMSSYPYASNYIAGAVLGTESGSLPAYPVTSACNDYLTEDFGDDAESRVAAIGQFAAVFWNSDGQNTCLDPLSMWDTYNSYIWDYLYCRSLLMPNGMLGGEHDMFWTSEWSQEATVAWCNEQYEIEVDVQGPASVKYGGRGLARAMSNVVFSNGDMDPWMPGGVSESPSESLVALMVEGGGHHLDLMFSNSADPASVVAVREAEAAMIRQWIMQSDSGFETGMCSEQNVEEEKVVMKQSWISAFSLLM